MKLDKIKRLAMQILKTGEKNVWINPERKEEIEGCMTKEDVRQQIADGSIRKKLRKSQSKGRTRQLKKKRKRGRKRGAGKKRGTKKTRVQKKQTWVKGVRAQRKYLTELKENKKVTKKQYSKIYRLIKGGYFRGKRYIDLYLKE